MTSREPFVDKLIVSYLKEVYSNRELLDMTKKEYPAKAIGFMYGVQEVINRLEAISLREEEENGIY